MPNSNVKSTINIQPASCGYAPYEICTFVGDGSAAESGDRYFLNMWCNRQVDISPDDLAIAAKSICSQHKNCMNDFGLIAHKVNSKRSSLWVCIRARGRWERCAAQLWVQRDFRLKLTPVFLK